MGLCSLSDIRDYWSQELGQEQITSVFSQHRFRDLFGDLHCNDNTTALPRDHEDHDKLFQNLIGKFSSRKRSFQPNVTQRYNGLKHFVVKAQKRGLCENDCGSKVQYKCTKCDVFLCIVFLGYHLPKQD